MEEHTENTVHFSTNQLAEDVRNMPTYSNFYSDVQVCITDKLIKLILGYRIVF